MATRKKVDPEKLDPSGANKGREKRAELIDEAQKADAEQTKAAQAAAKASGLHEAKLDDAGAREQQEAAERNEPLLHRDDYEGPPVVAPVIEETEASIKIISPEDNKQVKESRQGLLDAHVVGEGFLFPGEVIVDISRPEVGDHHRVSQYSFDGRVDVVLSSLLTGPGEWQIFAEQTVTQVGEGRDDHLPLIKRTAVRKITIS